MADFDSLLQAAKDSGRLAIIPVGPGLKETFRPTPETTYADYGSEDLRDASEDETAAWLGGEISITGARETDHGLLIPRTFCHCGDEVFYDDRFDPRLHRRCNLIP